MRKIFLLFNLLLLTKISLASWSDVSWYNSFQADAPSDCAPVTVTFTDFNPMSATSAVWDFGDGSAQQTVAAGTTLTHAYATSGSYYVSVYYLNAAGGFVTNDGIYVNLNGNPSQIYSPQTSACPGDNVQFYVDYWNYDYSQYSFVWDYGDGNVETTNYNNVQHVYNSAGTYTVNLTVNAPCGTFNVSTTMTIGTNIPFTGGIFDMNPDPVCPGDQVYAYYSGAADVFIQFGDGTYSNNSYYHTYNQPGTYIATATLTNGCGNSATLTDTIHVINNLGFNPNNSIWVNNSSPICPGQSVRFDASSEYSSVVWYFSDGTSQSGSYLDKIINSNTNDTVFVTVTNGCGADTTVTTIVQVDNNLPVYDVELWMPPASCTNSAMPYSAVGLGDPDYSYSYHWDFGDGSSVDQIAGSHVYAADGTYNVTLTVTNSCGIDSVMTQTVTTGANVAPDPNFAQIFAGPENGACVGDSILLVVFPYVSGTYSVDYGDGHTASNFTLLNLFGRDYAFIKYAYSQTGSYNIDVTYTNDCGLSWTKSLTYLVGTNVSSSGDFFWDENKPICFGDPILFNSLGGSSYTWDFGDGTGTYTSNSTFVPVAHTYQNPGVYTVNCKVENGCGNSEILTKSVTVPDNKINITTNTVDAQCHMNTGRAIAVITGGTEPYDVVWSSGDTTILVDSLTSGLYVVNVTDKTGCYNFAIATISDAQAPAIIVNNVVDVSCNGGNDGAIDINVIGSTGPYTYQWSNGANTEDIANLVAGPYEIYVTDANGCKAVASFVVNEPEKVLIGETVINSTCGGHDGSIAVNAIGNSGPFTYVWSDGHVGASYYNAGAGIYTVNVIDQSGCIITQQIPVSEDNGIGGPAILVNSVSPLDCNGPGSTIDISVYQTSSTSNTFQWSNGATTEDITVTSPGTYSVTVTTQAGCKAIAIVEVEHALPESQQICMVTVDSTYSVNEIVWEKAVTTNIESYNIYRESSQNGLYYLVGNVPYDSLSLFVDYVANPMITSWRYKISAVDFCGQESPMSDIHKTIHLNQNLGLSGVINLIWDHYEGFTFPTYQIVRYTASGGWNVIGTVSSANTSWTDATPPNDPTLFYVVEALPGYSCTATRAQNNNTTRSNRTNNPVAFPSGVNEVIGAIEGVAIFPNPNNGMFTLQADFVKEEAAAVEIYNMEGQVVYSTTIGEGSGRITKTIDLQHVPVGVYFVRVYAESSSFVKKLVINK